MFLKRLHCAVIACCLALPAPVAAVEPSRAPADAARAGQGQPDIPAIYTLTNTVTLTSGPDGLRAAAATFDQRLVRIDRLDGGERLAIDLDNPLVLFRVPDGLARIEWPVLPGVNFSREDAMVLAGAPRLSEVETWGAQVDWPGLGPVDLVLFKMGRDQFGGLLSSAPAGVNVLRQMVFQRSRPGGRPRHESLAPLPCDQC